MVPCLQLVKRRRVDRRVRPGYHPAFRIPWRILAAAPLLAACAARSAPPAGPPDPELAREAVEATAEGEAGVGVAAGAGGAAVAAVGRARGGGGGGRGGGGRRARARAPRPGGVGVPGAGGGWAGPAVGGGADRGGRR